MLVVTASVPTSSNRAMRIALRALRELDSGQREAFVRTANELNTGVRTSESVISLLFLTDWLLCYVEANSELDRITVLQLAERSLASA